MTKREKHELVLDLYHEVDDLIVRKFFDFYSTELLDEKIKVLTDLINGKTPSQIPGYYDILELMPKDGEMWDL